jgi:hypothetical protein
MTHIFLGTPLSDTVGDRKSENAVLENWRRYHITDQWTVGLTVSRAMDLRDVQQAMEQLKAAKEEIAKMQAKRDVAEKSVREAKLAVQAAEK